MSHATYPKPLDLTDEEIDFFITHPTSQDILNDPNIDLTDEERRALIADIEMEEAQQRRLDEIGRRRQGHGIIRPVDPYPMLVPGITPQRLIHRDRSMDNRPSRKW